VWCLARSVRHPSRSPSVCLPLLLEPAPCESGPAESRKKRAIQGCWGVAAVGAIARLRGRPATNDPPNANAVTGFRVRCGMCSRCPASKSCLRLFLAVLASIAPAEGWGGGGGDRFRSSGRFHWSTAMCRSFGFIDTTPTCAQSMRGALIWSGMVFPAKSNLH